MERSTLVPCNGCHVLFPRAPEFDAQGRTHKSPITVLERRGDVIIYTCANCQIRQEVEATRKQVKPPYGR